MKRILFLIAASYCVMTTAVFPQAGQSGLAFLKLGVGARGLAMGEAYSSLAADPTAMYYNPAALRLQRTPQISMMHKEWIQDVRSEFIAGSVPTDAITFGASLVSTNVSDIELRSIPGPPTGTFGSHDAATGISLAADITPDIAVGITGKYLFEKLYTDESTGYGIDLGAIFMSPWNVRFSAVVCNLGSMSNFETEAPVLPRMFRIGAGYSTPVESMDGTLTLGSDLVSYDEEGLTHLHMGAEFDYHGSFALRAGYQTGYEAKSFSAGAGFRYGMVRVDYAFVPFSYDLGTTHTFSVDLSFE
jgi:hypothetical protein